MTAKTIQINPNLRITIPTNYKRVKLPFKRKWLNALRSGKFAQGKHALFRDNTYCCLGVLSKIQGRMTSDGRDGKRKSSSILADNNPCDEMLHNTGVLPYEIDVSINFNNHVIHPFSLTRLNDNGVSFEDIAKIIDLIWKE